MNTYYLFLGGISGRDVLILDSIWLGKHLCSAGWSIFLKDKGTFFWAWADILNTNLLKVNIINI